MTRASLESAIPGGTSILLDSSALIAYLGPPRNTTPVVKLIVDEFVSSGRNPALMSAVTAMELWVGAMRAPRDELTAIDEFIHHFPNLTVGGVDLPGAPAAAELRARIGLRTPDALIVASAMIREVRHLVTNDHEWEHRLVGVETLAVVRLDAHLPLP